MSDTRLNRPITRKVKIGYWFCTFLVAWIMGAGSIYNYVDPTEGIKIMRALGYPDYFLPWLGVAKILGTVVMVAPRMGRFREWAYAGFTFDLVGASVSHFATGAPIVQSLFPLGFLVPLLISYTLKRRIDG